MPYKALDGVVDDLSRYLQSRLPSDVDTLLPRDLSALTRVFPVLLQLSAAATPPFSSSASSSTRSESADRHSMR